MRYAMACHEAAAETRLFREYVCENMRLRGEGKYLTLRYSELIDPQEDEDAGSIVERVVSLAGLEVIHEPS